MALSLFIIQFPVSQDLILKLVKSRSDSGGKFLDEYFEVHAFLLDFILQIQSLFVESISQFLSINVQFQTLYVDLCVVLEVYELAFHLFLDFGHIFLFASSVKIEFMVVLSDTKLTTDAFAAKLSDTNDFLGQIVCLAF